MRTDQTSTEKNKGMAKHPEVETHLYNVPASKTSRAPFDELTDAAVDRLVDIYKERGMYAVAAELHMSVTTAYRKMQQVRPGIVKKYQSRRRPRGLADSFDRCA